MKTLLIALAFVAQTAQASNVIYIGDSQSADNDTLITKLKGSLSPQHKIVGGDAVCGATIGDHLNGGPAHCHYTGIKHMAVVDGAVRVLPGAGHVSPLSTLMSGSNADTVIVELGDNHLGDANLESRAKKMITTILASGRACVWITPASIQGSSAKCANSNKLKRAASDAIAKAAAETTVSGKTCKVINSFELTKANPPRSNDSALCVHYPGHYAEWANAITPALMRALGGDKAGAAGSGGAAPKTSVR